VRLQFTEPIEASFDPVKVYDQQGNRVDEDDARVDPNDAKVLVAGLKELSEGSYTVEWRVTSIDGHIIDDTHQFAVSHQDSHSAHKARAVSQETLAGIAHGVTQGTAAFLVGLAAFVALVWLPTGRVAGTGQEDATGFFVRCIWALFGVAELSLYAVRASGEPFSLGLLGQALSDTRAGYVWLARLGLGLLTAIAATLATWLRQPAYWLVAAGIGSALLVTLTLSSHAAAEEGILPFLADWLHVVAASLWMGGLLGFPLVLLGPLRAMLPKQRAKLRWRLVHRFSKMATLAVMILVGTGVYAALLHVPSVEALLGNAYGRALMVKLGLAAFLLAAGAVNLVLEGRGPFGRIVGAELVLALGIFITTGFLTSLPPPP
jgi:copper transport protein